MLVFSAAFKHFCFENLSASALVVFSVFFIGKCNHYEKNYLNQTIVSEGIMLVKCWCSDVQTGGLNLIECTSKSTILFQSSASVVTFKAPALFSISSNLS